MSSPAEDQGCRPIYAIVKTSNWFLASKLGRDLAPKGILNLRVEPA